MAPRASTRADWREAHPPAGCRWESAAQAVEALERPVGATVLCFGLDHPPPLVERLGALLSEGERARADRFRGARLRERFVAAHGVLRVLLGARAGCDPALLRFDTSGEPHGKPRLAAPASARAIPFNLSHAGGLALLAIGGPDEVGVDLEAVEALPDLARVGESVYTPRELAALRALPPERSVESWYRLWTRKEAALKAVGKGFGIDPRLLEILDPQKPPASRSAEFDRAAGGARWTLLDLDPAPGFVGTFAALGAGADVRLLRWPR